MFKVISYGKIGKNAFAFIDKKNASQTYVLKGDMIGPDEEIRSDYSGLLKVMHQNQVAFEGRVVQGEWVEGGSFFATTFEAGNYYCPVSVTGMLTLRDLKDKSWLRGSLEAGRWKEGGFFIASVNSKRESLIPETQKGTLMTLIDGQRVTITWCQSSLHKRCHSKKK